MLVFGSLAALRGPCRPTDVPAIRTHPRAWMHSRLGRRPACLGRRPACLGRRPACLGRRCDLLMLSAFPSCPRPITLGLVTLLRCAVTGSATWSFSRVGAGTGCSAASASASAATMRGGCGGGGCRGCVTWPGLGIGTRHSCQVYIYVCSGCVVRDALLDLFHGRQGAAEGGARAQPGAVLQRPNNSSQTTHPEHTYTYTYIYTYISQGLLAGRPLVVHGRAAPVAGGGRGGGPLPPLVPAAARPRPPFPASAATSLPGAAISRPGAVTSLPGAASQLAWSGDQLA
jgi:hypothetical protein